MSPESIPFALPDLGPDEIAAVVEALQSGWVSSGPRVREFEKLFAEAIAGDTVAVALNSATAGLHLALEALGLEAGSEVLVPTWTFTATAEVVRYLGAHPVLVDVDPATLNIDLLDAESRLTPRTRAIIPVHFGGLPVPARDLAHWADRHSLDVVEDAAHAYPASSDGVPVGASSSRATIFSFYATKTLTTGEGGMLLTRDEELANRARRMRLHGIDRDAFNRYRDKSAQWRYDVVAPGYKYNMTDSAAALGIVQLSRAEAMRQRRQEIATYYMAEFDGLPISPPPLPPPGTQHAWHLYVARLPQNATLTRDAFIDRMAQHGVACSVHFIPLHKFSYWKERYGLVDKMFPVASTEFESAVSLPLYSAMTDAQVEKVAQAVRRVLSC